MRNYKHFDKQFLNKDGHHSIAAIMTSIDDWTVPFDGDKEPQLILQSYMRITDCGSSVTLDFNITDKPDFHNALFKLAQLRDAINRFEVSLRKEANDFFGGNGGEQTDTNPDQNSLDKETLIAEIMSAIDVGGTIARMIPLDDSANWGASKGTPQRIRLRRNLG